MAVMGEQFMVLAGDSQFILGIANDNTDIAKSKLEEFFKSSPGLKSASVYNCSNGRQEHFFGDSVLIIQIVQKQILQKLLTTG